MPIRVKCGKCKKTLSVKDHLAGKKIKCPVCQTVVAVSAAPPTKASPTDSGGETPKTPAAGVKKAAVGKPVSSVVKTAPNGKPPGPPAKPGANGKRPAAPAPVPEQPPAPPPEELEAEAAAAFAEEPPQEEEVPKTIEFKCEWCDEMVTLPLDMAGKRSQCPNLDCRRIVKVPLPKVEGKKDWRKMDRVGPAAAIVNQPEQLDNAWGTENTTKARQDSLAKAGAVELPPKPPLGAVGILKYFFYACCFFIVIFGGALAVTGVFSSTKQMQDIRAAKALLTGKEPRITNRVLAAEVHRTIAYMYMQEGKHGVRRPADIALEHFQGARSLVRMTDTPGKDNEPNINEQLFLIELAVSLIDLGGDEKEWIDATKQKWPVMFEEISRTLSDIRSPEARAQGVREVAARLIARKEVDHAIKLATALSEDGNKRPTPTLSQQIALRVARGQDEPLKSALPAADHPALKELTEEKIPKELRSVYLRVGFAEARAQKDKFDDALALITIKGSPRDRLEACVGAASVFLAADKPEEAGKLVDKAFEFSRETPDHSPWHLLQLVKLAARTKGDDALKEIVEGVRLSEPFKIRALLEVVLAKCDKATAPVSPEILADLEAADKEGITLALAWHYVARQQSRLGQKRASIARVCSDHLTIAGRGESAKILPIVEIGAVHGSMK